MKIADLSIRRSVTTTMMVLLVVLLGIISLGRINMDLFPNMSFPIAAVITDYQGVGPHEIETMVTRPLENVLATVTNIKSITSTSNAGQSLVLVEFDWGVDMNFATLAMREKIDMVKRILPDGVGNPMVVKFDPSMLPIMNLGVTGEDDLVALKQTVEKKIIPRLERIEGVASVGLTGGLNREILIEIDQAALNNYGISPTTISQTLMLENMNLSGGEIVRGNMVLLVRTTGKFTSLEEIRDLRIQTATGLVPLYQVAEVKDTYKEMDSMARMNGKPSVGLTIQKQTDANTVKVTNSVKAELAKIASELGGNLSIVPIMDQAEYIEESIGNVQSNAVIGGILAILVLYFFLRNLRSTIIIATAIPVSVITTFTLVYFGGLTLNMMTLGGLALGIGMLVDNAIVVLENIYRYRQEGHSRIEAASLGTQEVSMAIVASTLTTVIVFLPVVFVQGITSQLFKELALTITFSLLASLVVALTLIPMLSSKILKISAREQKVHDEGEKSAGWLSRAYRASLEWAVDHRWVVILILIVVMGGSAVLYPLIGSEFIPEMDQGEFTIDVQLPVGTVLAETARVVEQVEERVLQIPEVAAVFTNVGTGGQMLGTRATEIGSVMVRLKDLSERKRSTAQVMEELRQSLRIPDAEIGLAAAQSMGGSLGGAPITIKVKGNDLDVLESLTKEIARVIADVPELREIEDTVSEGRPELQISIDRALAAQFGLRVTQVASAIKTAIQGDVATRYEVDGQEYDVRVRMQKSDRETMQEVQNLLITSPLGARVPLSRIAEFAVEQGPQSILRENQVRYTQITADIFEADLGRVMEKVQKKVADNVQLPDGYEVAYTGQYEEMVNAYNDLLMALVLAIVLVYMVLASQFESLLHPFIIMFTVPMAAIGVLWGLFLAGHSFSVPAYIGMIMLAGIVVNNAIVLVDYINTLRGRGYSLREAIIEAGPTRLRPIMMTALTTILGLIPLALGIGEGSEVQAPMAVVVIGGLVCTTVLTLYVVPVLYSLFTGVSNWVKGNRDVEFNEYTTS